MNLARRLAFAALAAAVLPLAAFSQAKASSCLSKDNIVKVRLTTSMGLITLQLDAQKAPLSTGNFVKYVESGFYNGTIFHRVIDGFMIQGGGFTKEGSQKATQPPIPNEARNGLSNDNLTVAMARTDVRDSATSQFFISVGDTRQLNYRDETPSGWGYAVFGKVVDGIGTVDKIRKVPVKRTALSEAQPLEPVVIEKAECI